mmetsp:Transcript_20721/g.34141  ORF Transcript_20721/g.34141 Transcript_20721/m.34141 type:complete len:626 (+) Transcript_20721:168-2045(+)|eukprot:CAMPEP_0184676174 /NCGR_PEP_ID=MMETSP0308-20130426/88206_1 /TAXON_ID=38269 /ORGANISM="Gloeochaete witrockiana, Strain SAG 46.84" /LENGTH=625 /DNA_ID=CAMNT_0027123985 /DNA_START=113 /DNA_END=1990 /DNA_ORIENTATION=-
MAYRNVGTVAINVCELAINECPLAPLPVNEVERVQALHDLNILDSPHEETFDAICETISTMFDVPIACVALVDSRRVWNKARIGFPAPEISRDGSFCSFAILQPDVFMVPDMLLDERFCNHFFVTKPPFVRFYCAIPLRTPEGLVLGTLCIADLKPRSFADKDLKVLKNMSKLVLQSMSLRLKGIDLAQRDEQQRVLTSVAGLTLDRSICIPTLFDMVIKSVASALNADCVILLEKEDGDELLLRASFGLGSEGVNDRLTHARTSLKEGRSIVFAGESATKDPFASEWAKHGLLSGMSAILDVSGHQFGVICAYSKRQRHFTENDQQFLKGISYTLCLAVERILKDEQLIKEQKRADALLLNILPESVIERMKSGEKQIADCYDHCTLLFADLVSFTAFAEDHEPQEVVGILGQLFSRFDSLCDVHGVEKIKTIGDCYMAWSHETTPDSMLDFAMELLDVIKDLNEQNGWSWRLRIGISTGNVVAGVIGAKKTHFDVWGDVVNSASRMESTGVPNRIQVTEATYRLTADLFDYESQGEISVKGKRNKMSTYLLIDRKGPFNGKCDAGGHSRRVRRRSTILQLNAEELLSATNISDKDIHSVVDSKFMDAIVEHEHSAIPVRAIIP